jgi:hypothetical protein
MPLNELNAPPMAQQRDAYEILRVWTGNNLPQQCVLQTSWQDPFAWGLLLVDIARHAARAYANVGTLSEQEALERIKRGFEAEWSSPTDEPQQVHG